jgi:hypothetical protein
MQHLVLSVQTLGLALICGKDGFVIVQATSENKVEEAMAGK